MKIETAVSVGEFLDTLTILEIKSERVQNSDKLKNIRHELEILKTTWARA